MSLEYFRVSFDIPDNPSTQRIFQLPTVIKDTPSLGRKEDRVLQEIQHDDISPEVEKIEVSSIGERSLR